MRIFPSQLLPSGGASGTGRLPSSRAPAKAPQIEDVVAAVPAGDITIADLMMKV